MVKSLADTIAKAESQANHCPVRSDNIATGNSSVTVFGLTGLANALDSAVRRLPDTPYLAMGLEGVGRIL